MTETLLPLDEVYLLDDVVDKIYADLILSNLTDDNLQYTFVKDVGHVYNNTQEIDNFAFARALVHNDYYDHLHFLLLPMLYNVASKIRIRINRILMGRAFLTTTGTPRQVDYVHIDQPSPHTVILYYANDSDGDTILYNHVHKLGDKDSYYHHNEEDIFMRITPKKGRAVVFNGLRYHTSTRPSRGLRLVTNYNII